ncbi:MAG: class I SAM-dependent methyltransferase [Planctomycetes bacterium]|nr:class I SAM-dependent methyltransferase [Planctomycetota bacterium]
MAKPEEADVREYYDRRASQYVLTRGFSGRTAATMFRLLVRNAPSGPVLELGCGTGNLTRYLCRPIGREVVGLDLSPGMLGAARRNAPEAKLAVGDACRLPFREGTFAMVLGAYFLHHIDRWHGAIAEARRVLMPGGWLAIITSGHQEIERNILARFFTGFVEADKGRFQKTEEIEGRMDEYGFKGIRSVGISMGRRRVDQGLVFRVRSRFVSTLSLLDEEDFERGVTTLEAHIDGTRPPRRYMHRGRMIIGRVPFRERER